MSTRYELILSAVDRGVKAAFRGVQEGATRGQQAIAAFNKSMGNGQKAGSLLTGQLGKLISAYTALAALRGLKDAAIAAQSLSIGFQSIMGSAGGASAELSFLRSTSEELRLNFYTLAESYKSILASGKEAGIGMSDIRNVFVGVSAAGTALKLSNESVRGSLYAISQMMSKGKISAEELRQQLGERLPGAFPLAAKAMGVTTAALDDMLKSGELVAEDFIPKFAAALNEKYGAAAKAAAADTSNLQAAINDFATAWMDFRVAVAESGFIKTATGSLKNLSDVLKDPQVQNSVSILANSFFKLAGAVANFALKHTILVGLIGGSAGLIWALKKLQSVIKGVNEAFISLTGRNVLLGISNLTQSIVAAIAKSTLLTSGLIGIAGISLGVIIADVWMLYDGFTRTKEAAERLYNNLAKLKEKHAADKDIKIIPDNLVNVSVAGLQELIKRLYDARAYWQLFKQELEAKSKETSFGVLTQEAMQAQKELVAVNGRLAEVNGWIDQIEKAPGFKKVTEEEKASVKQMEKFKETAKDAFESAQKSAQDYADKIAGLNQDIASRDLSLQDKIREMKRQNMTDDKAAADTRKQALEREREAVIALETFKRTGSQSDLERLKELAASSESAWGSYADQGKKATGEAIKGMTRVNSLLNEADTVQIDTFSKMKADAEKAMADITAMIDKINKSEQIKVPVMLEDLKKARDQINDLVRDETKHITIEVNEKHGHGGRVGMAGGGRFPGNSKTDSIPVLARPGEGFVRNEALSVWDRLFGTGFFEGINAPWSGAGQAIIRALSGQIRMPAMPAMRPAFAFAAGGRVSVPDNMRDMGMVKIAVGDQAYPVMGRQDVVAELKNALSREQSRRSNK